MTSIDFTACVTLKRKKGVPQELFDLYWRDVHGPIAARIPGQQDYYQHHLTYDEGGAWHQVPDIDYDFPEEDRFNGLGEGTFATDADVQRYFTGAGGVLMKDEPNLFEETVVYTSRGDNSKTFIDNTSNDDPLHRSIDQTKFLVFFKKADGVSIEDFRRFMSETYAPALAGSGHVLKLRLHLPDEHDNTNPPNAHATSQSVSHYKAPEKQYQGVLEVVFADRLQMSRTFASTEYTAIAAEQPKFIRQIHTYTVNTYTLISGGELTLAGVRGYHEAELITRIGAANQLEDDVVRIMTSELQQPAKATTANASS